MSFPADDSSLWPTDFRRVPRAKWTKIPIHQMARRYDAVGDHGWYENLTRTVQDVAEFVEPGDRVVDYSAGTGIFSERLLRKLDEAEIGLLLADSSPKFLRLALKKLEPDVRTAFRRLRWLRDEKRIERLSDVLPPDVSSSWWRAVVSTNAVHLYADLVPTFRSWRQCLRTEGRAFIQSGNIEGDHRPEHAWIIDATVEEIHRTALRLVRVEDRWQTYRETLEDSAYMEAHDELRRRIFPTVRTFDHYRSALEEAGFRLLDVDRELITVDVDEWHEFLSTYHEGILGWLGGAEKVTGQATSEEVISDRRQLMSDSIGRIFEGKSRFEACWTYITAEPV